MMPLYIILFLGLTSATTTYQTYSSDKFSKDALPEKEHMLEADAKVISQCHSYCGEDSNCHLFAFSSKLNKCRTYNHTGSIILPKLTDAPGEYKIYYKTGRCPDGWKINDETAKCYKIFVDQLRTREEALTKCEEQQDSELFAAETISERDWMYTELGAHSALGTQRFWLYNYRFGDSQWVRTVPEFEGWERRMGNTGGYDLASFGYITREQCLRRCERTYGNACVAVVYSFTDGYCWLKSWTKSVAYESTTQEIYERVGKHRPGSMRDNMYYNAQWMYIDGQHNNKFGLGWIECIQYCRSTPGCVFPRYRDSDGECRPQTRYWRGYTNHGDYKILALPENTDACARGRRYQDRCIRTSYECRGFQHWINMAGQTQGRLWYPRTKVEGKYVYLLWWHYGNHIWMPYHRTGGVWRNWYTNEAINNGNLGLIWKAGQPNGPSDNYRAILHHSYRYNPTVYDPLADEPEGGCFQGQVEHAAREHKPRDCKFTPPGREYASLKMVTSSGKGCVKWTSSPYTANKKLLPEDDMTYAQAYCRNPDPADTTGPFCMTYKEGGNVKESCGVPMCPETDWKAAQDFDDVNKPYVHMVKEGGQFDWQTSATTEKAYAVCEMKPEKFCPIRVRNKCLWKPNRGGTYAEAVAECAKSPGWRLAELETQDEIYAAHDFANSEGADMYHLATYGYWVGSKKTIENGSDVWRWNTSGREIAKNLWLAGYPSSPQGDTNYCARMRERNYDIVDIGCVFTMHFFCEMVMT